MDDFRGGIQVKRLLSLVLVFVLLGGCVAFAAGSLGTRQLSLGMQGDDVLEAQQRLTYYKDYSGKLDGIYGSGTYSAVKAFQQRNKLTVTGKIDSETATLLLTDTAVAAVVPDDLAYVLWVTDSGEAVKELQRQLRETYYYSGKITGIYDADLIRAVKAYQASAGLTVDGKAGKKTRTTLYNRTAAIFNGGIPRRSLSAGDRGWDVLVLQQKLYDLNYLTEIMPDGVYGSETTAAVKAFQKAYGLKEDGKYGATVKRYLYPSTVDAQEEAANAEQGTEDDPYEDPILRFGSHGSAVANAQMRLKAAGYLLGKADGVFGKMTKEAVLALQKDYKLKQDGVIGRQTWAILKDFNISNAEPEVVDPNKPAVSTLEGWIQYGDKGAKVTKLQQALIKLGYLASGEDDGVFGPKTKTAVVSFQKAEKLQADGIVGSKTQVALNEALGVQWITE